MQSKQFKFTQKIEIIIFIDITLGKRVQLCNIETSVCGTHRATRVCLPENTLHRYLLCSVHSPIFIKQFVSHVCFRPSALYPRV